MRRQPGFFDIDERMQRLSGLGASGGVLRRGRFRDVSQRSRRGAWLLGRRPGREAAVRSGDDVHVWMPPFAQGIFSGLDA